MKLLEITAAADLHLMDDIPSCRKDIGTFHATMLAKLGMFLQAIKPMGGIGVVAGDFFDWWKPSPWLIGKVLELINRYQKQIVVVPGQHDLPQHSLENIQKSGLYAVMQGASPHFILATEAEVVDVAGITIACCPYGTTPKHKASVLLWHKMAWINSPYPGAPVEGNVTSLIKALNFPLIITGDNHQTFDHQCRNRLWVNPGSMIRTRSDQVKHKPGVYQIRFDLDTNECDSCHFKPFPIKDDVVEVSVHMQEHERDEQMEKFISALSYDREAGIDFEANIVRFLAKNQKRLRPSVVKLVEEAVERKD